MKLLTWATLALASMFSMAIHAEEQQIPSRIAVAKAVLADVEQRFDASPWTQPIDGQFSKLGAYAMRAVPGYSWAVLRKAVNTGLKAPPFLLGDSLLEQVKFLYLHNYNDFERQLKLATAPTSELWTSSPVDTVKFARAVAEYSSSDAVADDVFGLIHLGTVPWAVWIFVSVLRGRRSHRSEEEVTVSKNA